MASRLGFFSICKQRSVREPEQTFWWLSVAKDKDWDRVGVHRIK